VALAIVEYFPASHKRQPVAPSDAFDHVPTLQSKHDVCLEREYVPAGHIVQKELPFPLEYVPA